MKYSDDKSRHKMFALAGSVGILASLLWRSCIAQEPVDWSILDEYCLDCHNLEDYAGGIAFDLLSRDELSLDDETWELTIRKLQTGMMPPSGEPRPERAVLDDFTQGLASNLDREYNKVPNPGNAGIRRLNRAEYRNVIRDLLNFDASRAMQNIPAESEGEGFDNNINVLSVSPTLIDAYASTAMKISREAVGDETLIPFQVEYSSGSGSQEVHREGLPLGTRGGFQVTHNFPLDANYEISVNGRGAGGVFNSQAYCSNGNEVVVSLDGKLLNVDDPASFQLPVSAGPHTIGVALRDIRRCTGVNDFYDVYNLGGTISGIEIAGPFEASGPGNTPSRRAIFSCYPETASEELSCATEIASKLATRGYRQPVSPDSEEVKELLTFYEKGRLLGGFETGVQYIISRLLIDPKFLYRIEKEPAELKPGELYSISDLELASRLSFFLWSSIPDDELLEVAASGRLHESDVLEGQVRRMLHDPKIDALVENFAGQWLMLRELEEAEPQDAAFDTQLMQAFRQETELMFSDLVLEDRELLSLLDTDYTWLNEQLAEHYGIDGVQGEYMRRVPLPDDSPRRGLLGKGSILTATSVANRTSPVIRGTWIVEDILGAPVPTPPPGVEANLEESSESQGGAESSTLRARLERHRENPGCASCHQIMDPIGLALGNFDLVGRWRTQDNGYPLNTNTQLIDGTPISGVITLRKALLDRGDSVVLNMIEKLMSYGLGRDLHATDMAAVRKIAADTSDNDHRFSEIVMGIVNSLPFRMKIVERPKSNVAINTGGAL